MKQTIIYKLKPNKEQEGHLHNLCSIATKLYNTEENMEKLKLFYPNIQDKELAKILGWSRITVIRYAKKLGLNKSNEYINLLNKKRIQNTTKANTGIFFTEKRKTNISNSLKGRKITWIEKLRKPKTITEKVKQAHKLRKGIPTWNKGKTDIYSEETLQKIRDARLRQIFLQIDTSIELKIKKQLEEANISFKHPFNLGNKFQCDFYIPSLNLIVEADGDYWHNREDIKKRDKAKNYYITKCGYNILRIWEKEIKQEKFSIITKLKKYLQLFPMENRSINGVALLLVSRIQNVIPR